MHEAAKRLAVFDEEIERSNYIEAVAKAYRVNVDELRKLVVRTAVQTGLAKPVEKPRTTRNREKEADDGILKSQRILLTWMIDDANVLQQIRRVIRSDDFTEPLYRTVAELLYQQMDEGLVNPAQIMNHFSDEEEHRKVAELFHTKIRELTTREEQEKALNETVRRVKQNSLDEMARRLEPTDIAGLQKLMEDKRALQDAKGLHISII